MMLYTSRPMFHRGLKTWSQYKSSIEGISVQIFHLTVHTSGQIQSPWRLLRYCTFYLYLWLYVIAVTLGTGVTYDSIFTVHGLHSARIYYALPANMAAGYGPQWGGHSWPGAAGPGWRRGLWGGRCVGLGHCAHSACSTHCTCIIINDVMNQWEKHNTSLLQLWEWDS